MNDAQKNPSGLLYRPLPVYSDKSEVTAAIARNSGDEIILLPLAIGQSFPDWKFAQDTCLKLTEHPDNKVSSNACLGLAYIARTHGRLEKHLVKPVLLRELKRQIEMKWRIEEAISDINLYLKWNLASKFYASKDSE
jgi:hypothetical protein